MADSLSSYWNFDVLLYLEMTQQLPEQSCKERAAELKRLDAVLTQIKAELPQITDPEIVEAVKLMRSL